MAADKPDTLFEAEPEELPTIESIHVERLHGKFSYDIDLTARPPGSLVAHSGLFAVNEDRLTLLYGNNGTGKTSILRLLFHALSPADGHRKMIEATRFASLIVHLTNGIDVRYLRASDELSGAFRCEIGGFSDGTPDVVWDYYPEGDPRRLVTFGSTLYSTEPALFTTAPQITFGVSNPADVFAAALQELRLNPVFLSDSRAITGDVLERGERMSAAVRQAALRRQREAQTDDPQQVRRHRDVEDALVRVRTYLSQLVLAGTQAGSQRVDTVYVNVAAAIIQHASKVGRPNKQLLPSLRVRIAALGKRAQAYHTYGLLPEFPAASLIDLLSNAPDRNGPLLERVLSPYLDGLEERMDALEPGLRAIASFVEALNSFLEGKRADFRPGQFGITITDEATSERIAANELSSGEKQIVLLFSDIVALQGQTRLFLIDEPELSLNPQWQRQLMPRLLEVTEGSAMQVLAATHSIEIMAKYRRRIRKLTG